MQGGWEDDESVESAAQRETVEEAGVRGVLEVSPMTTGCGMLPGCPRNLEGGYPTWVGTWGAGVQSPGPRLPC